MRYEGTLTTWHDDRGFGFITPTQGGQDVFVHIKAFQRLNGRPLAGQRVSFEVETTPEGKKRACRVQVGQSVQPAFKVGQAVLPRSRPVARPSTRLKTPLLALLVLLAALYVGYQRTHAPAAQETPATASTASASASDDQIRSAYAARRSNVQVTGQGTVAKVLADDNDGSRHQRFILALPSGLSVLVAHNIDLAPRINGLQAGDVVAFNGEYEWNDKGGVIHWTHHDPAGRHAHGWLKHAGRTYQ